MGMTCLLVIDVQHDFLEGGALAVPGASEILEPLREAAQYFNTIVMSQDWHPADHSSFAVNNDAEVFSTKQFPYGLQVMWPKHCVQGSLGAQLADEEMARKAAAIIRKGQNRDIDSYSAFVENDKITETGLDGYLRTKGITNLVLAGLATDYCVGYSALDAIAKGYNVTVRTDLCRGIDPKGVEAMLTQIKAAGGQIV